MAEMCVGRCDRVSDAWLADRAIGFVFGVAVTLIWLSRIFVLAIGPGLGLW
jgi:hypothetical protein